MMAREERILSPQSSFLRELLLAEEAKCQAEGRALIVAIDGRAAAGKSTLAEQLHQELGAGVIHMDDFYLPTSFRTPQRYEEPGGNVHYERFSAEVIPLLSDPVRFAYRQFDCKRMELGEEITVEASGIHLVEGAYSFHPAYGAYANLRLFFDIEPQLQEERIAKRNGPEGLKVFQERWIPLEEKYHQFYQTAQQADWILKS